MRRTLLALSLVSALAACSSSTVSTDAAVDQPVALDAPAADAPAADTPVAADVPVVTDLPALRDVPVGTDAPPPVDAPLGGCPAGNLCFVPRTPVASHAIVAGRLAVVWFQINDDGPDPDPQVAYDVPFAGAAGQVNIPISAIAAPNESVLYCARACTDEAMCPCTGGPRLGFAYVVVSVDRNANGRTDVTGGSAAADAIVASGYTVVVASPTAKTVASAPLNMLFTAGIAAGVVPYPLMRGASNDLLGAPDASRVYDLNFCPPEATECRAYIPDLG